MKAGLVWLRDQAAKSSDERAQQEPTSLGSFSKMFAALENAHTSWDKETLKLISVAFHPDKLVGKLFLQQVGKYFFNRVRAMLGPIRDNCRAPFQEPNQYGKDYAKALSEYRGNMNNATTDERREKYVIRKLASGEVPEYLHNYVDMCDLEEHDDDVEASEGSFHSFSEGVNDDSDSSEQEDPECVFTFLPSHNVVTHEDGKIFCPLCEVKVDGVMESGVNMLEHIRTTKINTPNNSKCQGYLKTVKHERESPQCQLWGNHVFHGPKTGVKYTFTSLFSFTLQNALLKDKTLNLEAVMSVNALKEYIAKKFTYVVKNFAKVIRRKKVEFDEPTMLAFREAWSATETNEEWEYDLDSVGRLTNQLEPYLKGISEKLSTAMVTKLDDSTFVQHVKENYTPAAFLNRLLRTLADPEYFWNGEKNIFIPGVEHILPH
jgi:uncharacterized Zn finger protein (UPF0148 family)